jgi:hypothetical protein
MSDRTLNRCLAVFQVFDRYVVPVLATAAAVIVLTLAIAGR